MKHLLACCLLFVAPLASLTAGSGGSAYSVFGVGDLRLISGMQNAGMAGAGLALHSATSVNPGAPATWARLNRVRLEAGVLYEGFNSSDGVKSLYRAAGTFHGALLAVPISTDNGIVAVGGFVPYSSVNYGTFTRGTQQGLDYTLNHRGSGGLGRGLLGLSWAPFPGAALGASVDYTFGSLDRSYLMTIASPAVGGTVTESITSSGTGATASVLFDGFDRLSEALRPLSLGFMMSTRTRLGTTSQHTYQYTSETDSSAETTGSLLLPLLFGAGCAYQVSDRYQVAADLVTQQWGSAEFDGATSPDLRNSVRFAVGAERAANRDPMSHWVDRVAYRLGFAWNATYYRPDGNPVNEWSVTAGAGIPFGGDARLNLALEYARRGSTDNGQIGDSIIRVLLSLNISEQWFVRYEED